MPETQGRERIERPPEYSGWVVDEKRENGLGIFCFDDGTVYPFEKESVVSPVAELRPGQRVKFLVDDFGEGEEAVRVRRIPNPPLKEWLNTIILIKSQNGASGWTRGIVTRWFSRENPDKNGKFGYGFLRSTADGGKDVFFLGKSVMRPDLNDSEPFFEEGMAVYFKPDPASTRDRRKAAVVLSRV